MYLQKQIQWYLFSKHISTRNLQQKCYLFASPHLHQLATIPYRDRCIVDIDALDIVTLTCCYDDCTVPRLFILSSFFDVLLPVNSPCWSFWEVHEIVDGFSGVHHLMQTAINVLQFFVSDLLYFCCLYIFNLVKWVTVCIHNSITNMDKTYHNRTYVIYHNKTCNISSLSDASLPDITAYLLQICNDFQWACSPFLSRQLAVKNLGDKRTSINYYLVSYRNVNLLSIK